MLGKHLGLGDNRKRVEKTLRGTKTRHFAIKSKIGGHISYSSALQCRSTFDCRSEFLLVSKGATLH